MATEVVLLPGGGLIDEESGDTVLLPGVGGVEENESVAQPLNLNRISSMHFMRHYEPIAMGA